MRQVKLGRLKSRQASRHPYGTGTSLRDLSVALDRARLQTQKNGVIRSAWAEDNRNAALIVASRGL